MEKVSERHYKSSKGSLSEPAITETLPTLDETERGGDIYEIDPLRDSRWTALVERHPRSSVFHGANWLTTLRNVYGYDPVVITTNPPGYTLTNGIVFCRIRSWLTGSRLVSVPFSDHCDPLVSNTGEFDDLLLYTRRYVDAGDWKYVEIRPACIDPGSATNFARHLTYCCHTLDLKRSADEIFRHFHKDCVQRKIRRAERENLTYEEGTSEALLRQFYRLLIVTRRRKSLPPQPIAWFHGLVATFGKNVTIRVAFHGDIPVASIVTLSHKKTITYKYGCSDLAFNKLGGMAFLFWRTIREAIANGYDTLDLGRSDSDNLGLIAFKDHWGAVSTSLTYWKYPRQRAPYLWAMQNRIIRRTISVVPNLMLEGVGKLLYKHIG
jgi:Acetyltransferase (GNAT) domain